MRIAVLGGGPAGLFFAATWRSRHPADSVIVFEQNAHGATFGFGVVFSDAALEFLRGFDPVTTEVIQGRMETWADMTIAHRGKRVTIDGVGFSAIGRLELILLLGQRAEEAGADLRFGTSVKSLTELNDFDLIVAADGINSLARRTYGGDFGTSLSYLDEKFAWFGTTKAFSTLTQTFIETDLGTFNAHHYRYTPGMSTFIVECDRASWFRAGFDTLSEAESKLLCEDLFAETLDGHELIANKSVWRNFPWVWNERWSHRNIVLLGDALHTAHYSIGSGTRLALEDVLALVTALEGNPGGLGDAFVAYEAARRPAVEKLVRAAKTSAAWYADAPKHMHLSPLDFAYSYIMRTGRVDSERIRSMAPRFMNEYDKFTAGTAAGGVQ
jgi:2-polyprenyl-6-methoxyphenol hydroxylase-like FAD-dependent oxidoreductase